MATTMNMSGYEIERDEVTVEEYSDEVTYAGWNPQLELVSDHHSVNMDKKVEFPRELASADIDAFLQKMYEFQR